MTPTEIQILHQACKAAGVDATKIRPENPWSRQGGIANVIQMSVANIDPKQAAKWRVEAGGGLSVATLSEIQSGAELSKAAMEDLWNHDPQYVSDTIQQKRDSEQELLSKLEAESDRMRRARMGDKAVDFENQKQAAQDEARAESLARHNALQQRIAQRQVETARMAGRLN